MSGFDVPDRDRPVWFITGASSGIGRCLARQVLEHDAVVVATFRTREQAEEFSAKVPGRSHGVVADVRDMVAVQAAADLAAAVADRLDVLINAAGVAVVGAVEELTEDELYQQLDVNLLGAHRVLRATLPLLRASARRRPATIVNVSSVAGQVGYPGLGAYDASKAGLELLSEALHAELRPLGVRVVVVEPGNVRTDWAGRSMLMAAKRLPDYDQTAGASRAFFRDLDGHQEGDPDTVAAAIREVVAEEDPPLRLVVGADAHEWIAAKIDSQLRELAQWRRSTS
jgi:NAD(P)-dependent dehydrogenase (short-subunit alcohol dehydrogenase family)